MPYTIWKNKKGRFLRIYELNGRLHVRMQAFMHRAAVGRGLKHRTFILRDPRGHVKSDSNAPDAADGRSGHFLAHIDCGAFEINLDDAVPQCP